VREVERNTIPLSTLLDLLALLQIRRIDSKDDFGTHLLHGVDVYHQVGVLVQRDLERVERRGEQEVGSDCRGLEEE
jgi:hypothetical protein